MVIYVGMRQMVLKLCACSFDEEYHWIYGQIYGFTGMFMCCLKSKFFDCISDRILPK